MDIVLKILKGERAILSEFDLIKKKEERNRLLRFNQPNAIQASEIEMEKQDKAKGQEGTGEKDQKKDKKDKKGKNDKEKKDSNNDLEK